MGRGLYPSLNNMKFFVVLIILLNQAPIPKVYTYQFMTFNEIETCEVFIKTKRQTLKESIERQFPVETIHSSMMTCMTAEEIDRLNNQQQENIWQEPKHI